MIRILAAIFCFCFFSITASAAVSNRCDEFLAGAGRIYVNDEGLVLVPADQAAELVSGLIRQYRLIGGQLYWQQKKLKGAYAEYVDREKVIQGAFALGSLGLQLRILLSEYNLSSAISEALELAVSDYGRYELPQPEHSDPVY